MLEALCEKLGLCKKQHFALLLEHPQGPRSNKLAILRKDDKLAKVEEDLFMINFSSVRWIIL